MNLNDIPFEDEVKAVADKAMAKTESHSEIPFEDEVDDGGGIPFEDEKDGDYGVLQRQRDTVVSQTGDATTDKGTAFLQNVLPGALNEAKKERDFQLSNLERLRSGSAMKEISDLREHGRVGVKEKHRNEGRLRHGIAGEISDIGAGGIAETQEGIEMLREAGNGSAWEGFKKGLSEIFGGEKTPEPTDEEREKSYFDKMESIAKNAGIDEKRIGELRESAKTIEDFAEGLRGEAVKSLTNVAKNRKEASERLQKFKASTTDSILNGLVTNSGYTGGFILASMTGPMGYAALIGDSADQRIKELRQADYDVTPDGDLVVKHNEESAGSAIAKGIVGGAVEVGVEIALEKGLGWIFNGMNIPVGQGVKKALAPWLGKATETVAKGVSKPVKALGRAMSKNPAGKWLVGAAEGFGKYSQITGVHSIPMEMLEEHVQSFADDVLGLGVKSREHGGFGSEAKDWWNNKFWNYETNRDIFLGLVGTMAVQGTYAGTKAHHDIKKWRQNPSGYLKTMIDPKKVDALSDEEVAHLYKFVTSPNFTKDRVERFLQHVQGQTELANALLQLKEANTPFFETDKDALKQAVESGSIKSQFVPPTRESGMGTGQQVDWQPHVWKDGRRTMRAYDPNTGIAIDQIGGQNNRLVVTNRDGTRIEVGADESGDAFAKAMEIADRMSIHNQLLDMKRPMKQAYVESRIEALFPKGDFYILANNAELVETFPGIEKTRDYSPQNPAFTTSDGKVVVVLDNLKSAYEANRVILHEAAIHSGLKWKFTTDAKRKFLRSIDDPSVNSMTERLMNIRGVNSVDELSDEDIEEAFAHTWDRRRTSPTLAQKASHALREMARAVKLPVSYNTSDLEVMVDTLQREGQSGRGTVEKSTFDTTEHTKGVPYNEAQRDFSGDVADVSKPSENTPEKEAVRKMERLDRIKQNHPRMWEYAMRVNDNDEDAAADFIAKALEEEGMRGVAGEAERGFDALEAAAKLENGEDLTPADLKILDEHGFTGQVLYTDYGYRKQKNGVWKRVVAPETTNKQEKPDETGTGTDETPAQPESGTQRPAEPEVAGTEEGGAPGEEANGVVNGEGTKQGTKLGTKSEGSTEPMSENRFWNVMHRRGDRRRVPLDTIKIPDTQFKEDADPKTGVVPGHEIHEYYENAENPITLYERLDGSLELVTGRHRVDGAKRSGLKDIDARIFREADGYTPEDMKLYDAVANILDEKGTVKDYVRFFEESGFGEEDAKATGILSTTKGRMAFGIYKDASGDTRSAIDWKGSGGEGLISVEQAGIIAEAAPRDAHPRNAAVQRVLVRRALDGVRGKKLAILARTLAEEVKTRKDPPKAEGNTQLDLFTSEEDVALLEQEERRADYRAKKANDYKRIAEVLRTALRKGGRLDLNKGYAKELGITDPKDKRQLEVARDKAVERANYWENAVRLDDEDKAVMDRELGIETPKPKPKPKAGADDFSQKVVDAIDVDARDGLINVHADNRFGDGAYFASYAAGSEEEIKRAADGIRAAFPNMTVFTSEDGIAIVPKKETKPAPAENAMDRAKAAAEKHVVSYGNGMRGTLADMLANGNATLYPDKGLTAFDKGKPHVVTIGMEQFTPTKEELPYLIEVQRNYFKANPDQIPPSLRGMYSDIAPKTPKNTTVSAPAETPATTPPKATEAAQGGESASGDTIDLSDSLGDLGAMWFSREMEDDASQAKENNQLQEIYDIISTEKPEAAAKQLSNILQEVKDGKRRIRPYRAEEIIRGAQGRNHALGVLALVARATGESFGRNAYGGTTRWTAQDAVVPETRQRNALVKIAKGLGVYVDSSQLGAIISDEKGFLGRGQYSVVFTGEADDHVIKVREVSAVAEDNDTTVEGGAIWDFDDILLSNAILGKDFDTTLIGLSENNGHLYLILRQPKADSIPTGREVIPMLREYMEGKGFKGDAYARDYFDNDDYVVNDLRLGANIGLRDGKIFPFDPISAFSSKRRAAEGVLWMSRELEEHSDEEIQAHNMVLGVKIIKNFAAKGGRDFGQFARSVKAIAPEVYERIKNQMPGMWLNAWMGGEKSLSVPQTDEYEGILAATDAWKAPEKPVQKPQERTEQPKADNDTPKHKTRGEAISAAADEMIDLIRVDATQRKLTRKDMENVVAKHLGGSVAEGTFEMKDVTDIMELAVNRILKDDMFAPTDNPQQKITLIRRLLDRIPTQTTRSAEQDKMQQFSTVPHEAFAAAWVANITDADVMIEPSAGIGGIAVFAKNAGAEVILNELSERRREILEQLGLSPKVYGVNAEYLWSQFYGPVKKGEVKRPTVVVMNPPFSNSALTSRKDTIGVGGQHVEQALEMLAPGGRLVAIVGHGMAHDAESPKVRAWWKKIGEKYRIRADVTVNGDEYAKYGTTYDNNIIVIDKVAPDSQIKPVYGKIESIDDLPAMLEGVRNDRPAIQSEKVAEKPNGGSPATGTSGGASTGQRNDGGRNGVQSGNGGNGSAQPPRKPSGRTGGRVPGAREDGGRGNRTEPVRGVEPTVTGGLTTVNAAGSATSKETSPQEVGDGTFSTYKPAKVKIEGAKPHPTALVESTAMASVLPPDPTYSPILPKKAIEGGMPSDAQLEQIVYAGQAHEQILPNGQRRGYFFGDGTGLGKGTEIGGVISDNWNHGRRKAVWVSKESGLMRDAMRDLVTYGLDGQIFDFNPKKKSVTSRDMGVAFLSYDGLKQDCVFDTQGNVRSAKQGQKNRFQHLVEWLGKDFDGVIVFDEAHKAGNAVTTRGKRGAKPPAKQALAVVALQEALPNARILYVSATGATEVSNLSYATRLGLWGKGTAFRDREDFINRVSSGGLSVMEIVARDMKSMGVYMARSLSYDGIVNRKIEHALSPDQKRKYDEMADAWQLVIRSVGEALISTGGAGNSNAVTAAMSALWGGEQRFFNQLLTAMQMPSIIADAKKQLEAGNSVVFQLVNTNEATQKRAIEEQRQRDGEVNAEELDLSPRDIIIGYVRNSFPVTQYVEQEDEDGNTQWVIMTDAEGNPVENPIAVEARDNLLERLNMMKLDDNPLELIIDEFGAENVAEVTGRSRRRQMVRNDDGEMEMKLVSRSKKQGLIETDEFNAGKRRVLVFSDAGGTGRSFHADKRFGNQQKRIHYLVQAGWRADSALQGFGRTHRSNEALPPEYVLCSTDIRGHQRFISTVARRLAQLGSLTAGDRSSAGGGVFSEDDNLENQYAENALNDLFMGKFRNDRTEFTAICRQLGFVKQTMNRRTGEVEEVNQLLDKDDDLDTTRLTIPTFLNRILNMRVDAQNKLFDEFMDVMRDHIEAAKENGTFDPGLEKLQGDKIEELNRTELWSGGRGTGSTDIVEVGVSKKSRKVDYETVLARMQRAADGRNWFFARNLNSGKIFGFAETSRAKTLQSGAVVNQLRCFSPDGKAPLVLETDVRFDGPHVNFTRISEREAVELWGNALAEIPDLDTTKRYFVHGTMLPIWDRLAVQNPRIFRIAPNEGGSFLGMEVKAENVNDLLKRFGKAAQSVELTPEAVLNRIIKEGKKVPLLQEGWELKRSRVNGDYRVELVGPEERRLLEDLARDGLGTMERIGYVPRFFIPRTAEGLKKFLDAYPAMPEEGGIGTVTNAGVDYSSLSYEERQRAFSNLLQKYVDAFSGTSTDTIAQTHADLDGIIAAMPSEELMRIVEDYQQYDNSSQSPIHHMRTMVRKELQNRGAITDSQISELGLWFSRDLDELANDTLSSVAIHEVNAWRAARGLPEMPKYRRTAVESIVNAGKYMASNEDEMERFIRVSAETPHNWTAVEVSAVAQRRVALENDYDEKTRLINVAEMNGNREEARRIREARDLVQEQMDIMDRAINKAKREWGLAGLARRFMLNRDGTFARFSGELQSIVGRKLTEDEERGAQTLWNAYREAQGKLDEATVEKTAELLKDIVRKHMAEEEKRHRQGGGRNLTQIEREYISAIDHIRVHANRAGGVLLGLPDGRKWIDALRRYHMAAAIETGHHLDVNEMLAKIHEDIDGMVRADDHDIMQIITGHGNTYEADNSELEKALREQRRLMNEYQKWEDLLVEGHLPDKTGLIRDEPTQTEREAQRKTRELMREFMQAHPELLQMDASKRLKTIQDSLMKRWQNEIEDLRRAVENDERIVRQKNTMTYTPEMVERRRQLEEWRQRYREAFPPEPLTHEQKVAKLLRALQGRLAKLEEKKAAIEGASTPEEREAILAKRKAEKLSDPSLDAIRRQIEDVQNDIQDLHDLHFPEGTTEELLAMIATRKKALNKRIEEIRTLLANRDFAPKKREPSAIARRVAANAEIQELVKNRNAASKRLMQERERYRRSVLPYNAGSAIDWISVLMSAPRVMRTMLDLSATMAQGAALFTSHPVMGFRALVDSVKAFYSEENTDKIMEALYADPDFTEFQQMGGRVFDVSDLTQRGVPEEFRNIELKPLKINGREYGLSDIPGVKASERSFGTFLNAINLSVYKAIKASGGWGPTGPSESQKKDIALSLNVASGYGYTDKGGRGAWDKIMSAALWAPRFAVSGAKMAIGWNIFAPHWTGLTTERSYKDRMTSSKVAAQQYVRQIASMAAWTLLATLLMGRKDPEWLEEVLDPRSSNFLNVRIGNTNVNFFGPIKQWWTFMARVLTGQTRGADGVVRKRDRMQTAGRFVRGKLSPLAGLGVDLLDQKDFLGNKMVWNGSAGTKEVNGWTHVLSSLGIPLSMGDLATAFKENSLANALMLTPFILAGAAKSTYQLNEFDRAVNPYKAALRDLNAAWKEKRMDDVNRIKAENPELAHSARINSLLKTVDFTRKWIANLEKSGKTPDDDLLRKFEYQQRAVIDAIREARKPVDKGR